MNQTVVLGVWLGIAGLAVIGANLILWRARRVLGQSRQDEAVPPVRLVPSPVLVPSTMTTTMTKTTMTKTNMTESPSPALAS